MRNKNTFASAISILRVHQWIKNLFIFIPLFFSGNILSVHKLISAIIAFFAFSLTASSIYCLNDIIDKEADSIHPKKQYRPIASNAISIKIAKIIFISLFSLAVFILYFFRLPQVSLLLITAYWLLNIAYCLKIKKIALLDVTSIGIGFVLRIFIGGVATGTPVSQWLVVMTFLLALFLGFAKRLDDYQLYKKGGIIARDNIVKYNIAFFHNIISILSAVTIVAYLMYCLSNDVISRFDNEYIYLTSLFVILGLFRYIQITFVENKSGDPTKVLYSDRFIHFCIIGWISLFSIIIYV